MKAPLRYDREGRLYPHPTVYTKAGEEAGRGIHFEVRGIARSTTSWMGKFDGPYIIQGVYRGVNDVDTWIGTITLDGETIEVNDVVSVGEFTRVEKSGSA